MSKTIPANNYCSSIFDGTHDTPKPVATGHPLVTSKHIMGKKLDLSTAYYISTNDYLSIQKRSSVSQWDILFSMIGSVGDVYLESSRIIPYSIKNIGVFSCKNEDRAKWLYYYLQSPSAQTHIKRYLNGAVQKFLPLGALRDFPVIPFKKESPQIISVLSALDAKIELNQLINFELESMAKTLYDYWFVQFDFPFDFAQGKPDKNGKPYKTSGGKMAWNEKLKREIPLGWGKGVLSDIGSITGGSTPSREIDDYFDVNRTAWITPKDLSLNTGNKFITKGETGVSEKGLKAASLTIMPKGTILLSSRAPIGYMAISREVVTTNQGFKSFIPNKGYSTPYIYYTVKNAIPTIVNHSSGSTFKEVSGSVLKEIYICLPPVSITEKFRETVDAIFERQNKLELESQTLTELRDWLLPMLMNGQVKVN